MSSTGQAVTHRVGYLHSNHKNPWSDDELREVLAHAPTRANISQLALKFLRTPDAVELIYRYAGQSDKRLAQYRPSMRLVHQIRRLRRQVGWVAYGDNTANREALHALEAQHQQDEALIHELWRMVQEFADLLERRAEGA
jgi:hypothetical protein